MTASEVAAAAIHLAVLGPCSAICHQLTAAASPKRTTDTFSNLVRLLSERMNPNSRLLFRTPTPLRIPVVP